MRFFLYDEWLVGIEKSERGRLERLRLTKAGREVRRRTRILNHLLSQTPNLQ